MTQYSANDIARVARQAGFTGNGLVWAVAVALAESGGRTDAVGTNVTGSKDRGLWQINNRAHPDVSDAEALNPLSNAKAAYKISSGGKNWRPWSAYNNGRAATFLPRARTAVNREKLTNAAAPSTVGGTDVSLGGTPAFTETGLPIPNPLDLIVPGLGSGLGLLGGGVTNPLDAIKALVSFVGKAYEWFSNPHNWIRIAAVIGGGTAILLGTKMLADSGAIGATAAKASDKVETGAKLAAAVATKKMPVKA